MKSEIVGIEKVHRTRGTESVGNYGNTVIGYRLVAAFEVHNVDVSLIGREMFLEGSLYARRTHDEVDFAARVFVEIVDCFLNNRFADVAHARLHIRHEPFMSGSVESVQTARGLENRAETRDFVVQRPRDADTHALFYRACGDSRPADRNGLVLSVDIGNSARVARGLIRRRGVDFDVHADRHVFNVAARYRIVRIGCGNGGKHARAVAVQHSAEVESAGFQKPFHFVVEKVYERARVVCGGSDRLIRKGYRAVQIFKGQYELFVIVVARHGKISRFCARAYAAADAVSCQPSYFFTPHVRSALFDFREQRIDFGIELVADRSEI